MSTKNSKIARESPTREEPSCLSPEGQQYEWRKLVGSIRRRVQRHASTSGSEATPDNGQSSGTSNSQSRKNSLTRNKFDVFKWDKSKDELEKCKKETKPDKSETKENQKILPLTKQKSVGPELTTTSSILNNFKSLTFKDKPSSPSIKNIDSLISPKLSKRTFLLNKSVRKSDPKCSGNFSSKANMTQDKKSLKVVQKLKEDKNTNRDDFLKATMRIFLVVSPPVGKIQVNYILILLS